MKLMTRVSWIAIALTIAALGASATAVSNMSPRPGENPEDWRGLPSTNRGL